jgi:arylsulfatase A-like enzyme
MLTGIGPLMHGVNGRRDGVPEDLDTAAELLAANGYETAAFSTNAYITESAGFAQGFHHFDFAQARSGETTAKVLSWLDRRDPEKPFFLYVHTIDPHAPYQPSEPFRSRFAAEVSDRSVGSFDHIRAIGRKEIPVTGELTADLLRLYDAEVAENDHAFGLLLEGLRDRDLYDTTLIVFLSDHGEEFHEHGVFGHGWDLYREVVEVPMIVRPPGGGRQRRVAETVQLVDVVPTLLATAGLPIPESMEGEVLWSLIDARRVAERPAVSYIDYEGRHGIAVAYRGWKLIEPLSPGFTAGRELYRRADDREELDNVVPAYSVTAGLLASMARSRLLQRSEGFASHPLPEFDDDTRRGLQALGYVK